MGASFECRMCGRFAGDALARFMDATVEPRRVAGSSSMHQGDPVPAAELVAGDAHFDAR